MKPAITREVLDAHPCAGGACEHGPHPLGLSLSSTCHPDALLDVKYRDGVLLFLCGKCEGFVVKIAVASFPPKVTLQ
jgi:hypothetical protein